MYNKNIPFTLGDSSTILVVTRAYQKRDARHDKNSDEVIVHGIGIFSLGTRLYE